jgi:hypothetical protein
VGLEQAPIPLIWWDPADPMHLRHGVRSLGFFETDDVEARLHEAIRQLRQASVDIVV